jgi:hypothetical protein
LPLKGQKKEEGHNLDNKLNESTINLSTKEENRENDKLQIYNQKKIFNYIKEDKNDNLCIDITTQGRI